MYSTCLFCNRDLGRNQSLETFPVGRRLAFDAAKGRLWVVCSQCERWNLSPLEERWEAIEQAERLYGGTRLRAATDQIGLARLRDGTELVRIGAPMRPEFAAWRYGDQFGRRRRRQMLMAGAGVAAVGAVFAGGLAAGVSMGGFAWLLSRVGQTAIHGSPGAIVARVVRPGEEVLRVRRGHLAESRLIRGTGGPFSLLLRHDAGHTMLEGRDADRAASVLMPQVNRYGGGARAVRDAVSALEQSGGAEGYLDSLAGIAAALTRPAEKPPKRWGWTASIPSSGLFGLQPIQRLALEMALHEEAERRALHGELAVLEQAWREAEEIAAIADDLLVPASVTASLERMRPAR